MSELVSSAAHTAPYAMAMLTARRLAATGAALLLVIAPACGGDDDEAEAPAPTASGDAVTIADFSFKPSELEVKAGTTVTFTNEDGFAHTVTAKDKSYDSESLDEGESFEHTFDEPGTYEYLCSIHNSMTGSVVVE